MLQQSCQPVHCCSQITLSFECAEEHKCVRIEALWVQKVKLRRCKSCDHLGPISQKQNYADREMTTSTSRVGLLLSVAFVLPVLVVCDYPWPDKVTQHKGYIEVNCMT